jgi:succinoglycan biosynthesis protein ExoV
VGIGSLINNGLPKRTRYARKIVIFGTGVGYGKEFPKLDESYTIYCVRGLLSAQALGISEKLAITDGAVLIRQVFSNQAPKKYRFSGVADLRYESSCVGFLKPRPKLTFGWVQGCHSYLDSATPFFLYASL